MLRNISLFKNKKLRINTKFCIKRALKVDTIPPKIYTLLGMKFKGGHICIHDKNDHKSKMREDHEHSDDEKPKKVPKSRARKTLPLISVDESPTLSNKSPTSKGLTANFAATKEEPVDFEGTMDQKIGQQVDKMFESQTASQQQTLSQQGPFKTFERRSTDPHSHQDKAGEQSQIEMMQLQEIEKLKDQVKHLRLL